MQRLLFIMGSSLLLGILPMLQAYAQTSSEILENLFFTLPDNREPGTPGGREPGGSRGDCDAFVGLADTDMTALIPQEESEEIIGDIVISGPSQVWGQTTVDYPTLWFEVVDAPAEATFELRVHHPDGEVLYQTGAISVPETTGTFPVEIPGTVEALMPDQFYYWVAYLRADCSEEDTDVLSADGWVQRVVPSDDLADQLETATPEEAVVLYAQEGIWFDALNGLTDLYLERPDDTAVQAGWDSLLDSIGLPETIPPVQIP